MDLVVLVKKGQQSHGQQRRTVEDSRGLLQTLDFEESL